ncbi:putative Lysine-specific demethylase [Magnetospirillum gryphiswaldense MSR-1 v2]|uniref:Lysine-specific demethylase n=1 Tax=Magnetospirillum gryphiswaldense (strain DSM 6361 / JCM 21280 / NBRC 15271 / MSR-1) TaxID=431944 RepID=V6F0J9_MAGGM|nr:Lysine-specific demethylase [Magnetospirillum gryphiswaldense]CDK98028.1 putative Lysine-specific demethylase [Magnetospirillum gryphiswaldense MSR-1 v2]
MQELSFKGAIAPITPHEFLAEYWEKKPLLVKRAAPGFYRDLLSVQAIDQVLAMPGLHRRDIRVARGTDPLAVEEYADKDGFINAASLSRLFTDGFTIILNTLNLKVRPLAEICRAFEQVLSIPCQTNIYYTPRLAQGFKPHYDSHDVFVFQVAGRKHWLVNDTPVELPLRGQGFEAGLYEPGDVTMEFDLEPGDLLYIPRGVMHGARTSDEVSLHITLGALTTSWAEVLLEAVAAAALTDVELRRNLPAGYALPGYDAQAARQTFASLLNRVAENIDVESILDVYRGALQARRRPYLENSVTRLDGLSQISAADSAEPVPNLLYSLTESEGRASLACFGRTITVPDFAAPALAHAVKGTRFRVGELPGLDEAGSVALVRRLVLEGAVRLV